MPNFEGYENLEKIAEGKDRTVYSAMRAADKMPVVLKALRSDHPNVDLIALMYHEYELARSINYPGIIQTYSLIDDHNRHALVQEDMHGTSLHDYLQEHQITDLAKFLKLAIQMVKILGYLHQSHIIHKDIKPSNFIYDPTADIIKLTDFNYSTKLEHETQDVVPPSKLEGTLAYMAPEQTGRMNMNIDYRADFYALGVTFYEMLTGTLPFKHTDPLEMLHAHLASEPPEASNPDMDIPTVMNDIIHKLMAKNPSDRYQSVVGLQTDLEQCLELLETTGEINSFTLGREDIQDRLILSQKLYGREQETQVLLKAYERISRGGIETLMVCGYSGIGKTMLIDEVHKPMTKQKGYFIHGKFDQLLRDKPYTAITDALNQLAHHILAEPESSFEKIRHAILEAVGNVGQVIIDIAPDFELVIGPQPPLESLSPKANENRLQTFFKRFIRSIIDNDHPLVIFIDDLQWADSGSLGLLNDIMMDIEMHHLLLIGAYRDNEVSDSSHPLRKFIITLEEHKSIRTLPLLPLRVDDFSQLLQDTLHRDATSVTELAKLLHQRTEGNPFFCKQILQLIYRQGLLKFNYQQRRWDWNLSNITALGITDNVVDLMLNKLAELPQETQSLLKYASCIGNQFTLDMLMMITNKSAEVIGKGLWQALEQELLITPNSGYKRMDAMQKDNIMKLISRDITYQFIHDRVQQAAYQSIPENEKALIHLDIAHILVEKNPEAAKKERLFEVVDHFNNALQQLSKNEHKEVAKLNYLAAMQAKSATAYQPMMNYLTAAKSLINDSTWDTDYQLAFNIHREFLLAQILLRQVEINSTLFQQLLSKAKTNLDKAELYQVQIMEYFMQEDREQITNICQQVCQLFGVKFSLNPNPIQVFLKLMLVRWKMRKFLTGNVAASLPVLPSQEITIVFDIFAMAYFYFYEKGNAPFVYTILTMMELMLQYGKPKSAGFWLTAYGVVVVNVSKDFDTALLYTDIAEQYYLAIPDKVSSSIAHLWACHLISHWRRPLKRSYELMELGQQEGRETGNILAYLMSYGIFMFNASAEAKSIDKLIKAMQDVLKLSSLGIMPSYRDHIELLLLYHQHLKDNNEISERLAELERRFGTFESSLTFATSNKYSSFFYFFKNDYEKSVKHYFLWNLYEANIRYELYTPEVKALNALALMYQLPKVNSSEKRKYKKHLKKLVRDTEFAAKSAPMNYLHHLLFIKAYEAQLNGNYMLALTNYKLAIENAKKSDFTLWIALGYELIGDLNIAFGQEEYAIYSYRDARYYYQRYGMTAKVHYLAEKYPESVVEEGATSSMTLSNSLKLSRTSSGTSFAALDFMSIIKASQAISGEIILDKLFEKMLRVVFENAGATKAILIECRQEHLFEVASLELFEGKEKFTMANVEINQANNLSQNIVRYTIRSRESLVFSKSDMNGRFNQDPYIINQQPKSVFCLPILHQDIILGVLYLENNVTEGAFTDDRVTVLSTLASQIAVSLENARHYDVMKNLYLSTERFVPKAFLQLLQKKTIEDIQVGDSAVVNLATMFADIRNFTTISEAIGVDRTAYLLNTYMKQMTPIIRRHKGFVSHFLGDGIMALFPRHYTDALNAALEMRAALPEFNALIEAQGYDPIETGIGVHAGPAMLITLGEEERLDASVISDVVNSASRIEGLNKVYGTGLLISDVVYHSISDPSKYLMRVIDKVRVKGRVQAIQVYEVLIKPQDKDLVNHTQRYFDEFTAGFRAYEAGDFVTAEKIFQQCLAQQPEDTPARLLKERCEEFIKSGTPKDWDGTYTALEK